MEATAERLETRLDSYFNSLNALVARQQRRTTVSLRCITRYSMLLEEKVRPSEENVELAQEQDFVHRYIERLQADARTLERLARFLHNHSYEEPSVDDLACMAAELDLEAP